MNTGRYFTVAPAERAELDEEQYAVVCSLETSPLPMFAPLFRGVITTPHGEQEILAGAMEWDPLRAQIRDAEFLGFVFQAPLMPEAPTCASQTASGRHLVRTIDDTSRRHIYSVVGDGEDSARTGVTIISGGAILDGAELMRDALGILFSTTRAEWTREFSSLPRWILAPATWRGMNIGARPRLRAVARRSTSALRTQQKKPLVAPFETIGWVANSPSPGLKTLFSFRHPITGDQLLTHSARYAKDLGYTEGHVLGYSRPAGTSCTTHIVKWGSRFGLHTEELVDDFE